MYLKITQKEFKNIEYESDGEIYSIDTSKWLPVLETKERGMYKIQTNHGHVFWIYLPDDTYQIGYRI